MKPNTTDTGGLQASAGSQTHPYLSVVVPCYNEQECLDQLRQRLNAVCQAVCPDYEIVLVDDGSRDATWAMMQSLSANDAHYVCVKLSRNHGHQLALTAGLSVCGGERILIVDGDLQDPPELLPDMLRLMEQGADVVYGQRRQRKGEGGFKRFTAAMFYRLISRLSETPIPVDTGDFRLMSRRALDVLLSMPERHRFVRGMVSWIGFSQVPLLYDREARFAGKTKYPLGRMVALALSGFTSFSTKPLRFATYLGFFTGFLGLVLLAWSIIAHFNGHAVSGWASTVGVVALLSSIQLFVLGVFGEYLGRLYEQAQGRPLFIIDRVVRGGLSAPAGAEKKE